jgi:flagellar biosynthesis/type III secretory pathway chaperone
MDIMLQSLRKKSQVLDELMRQNEIQKDILEAPEGSADKFDEITENKAALIEQMEQLDSGFDKLYHRVKDELETNREAYAEQIREAQKYIREITDKSMQAQAQEARNKDLMVSKFSRVKKQARQMRASSKATASYYQSMARVNLIDPQFMDNKK